MIMAKLELKGDKSPNDVFIKIMGEWNTIEREGSKKRNAKGKNRMIKNGEN